MDIPLRMKLLYALKIEKMVRRKFVIGSEWIYYKLYTGPKTIENILMSISPKIYSLLSRKYIDSFHFVRYADPDYHIRLRLHCPDNKNLSPILVTINEALQKYVDNFIISKIQTDVYNRELERYGFGTIKLMENYFYRDSDFVIKSLKRMGGHDIDRWKISIKYINMILDYNHYSLEDKILFTETNMNGYYKEIFGESKEPLKRLNSQYRHRRNEINMILQDCSSPTFKDLDSFLRQFPFSALTNLDDGVLTSLIHMHINRMFRTKQRLVELVLYYYLHKYLSSEKAQLKYRT